MTGVRRAARTLPLALTALVLLPLQASAHAELAVSAPPAGAVLGTAPGAVVLQFTQPLDAALSEATVSDPSGHLASARPQSRLEIRVDLVTALPGSYRVTWTAVSALDGHTSEGSVTFAVESPAPVSAAAVATTPLDVAVGVARWFEDAALLLAAGALFIGRLARRPPALAWARASALEPAVAAVIGGAVVVSGEALLAAHGSAAGALHYLSATQAGLARVVRVGFEAVATVALALGARVRWPPLVAAVCALAASGHAATTAAGWAAVAVDAAHLVTAGVWAGGIVALARLRPPGGWRGDGLLMLRRFTPWALAAFAATVGLGVVVATDTVGSLAALAATAYGRDLLVKAGGVLLLVPLSLAAWRLRRPALRAEAAIALGVVASASVLSALPLPAASPATAAPALEAGAARGDALPSGDEVTLAAHAGQTLVGLSLDPGRPGPNRLVFSLWPVDGPAAASGLRLAATLGGRSLALAACGENCRQAPATLAGGERVTVRVAGGTGGDAGFVLPSLPAPDGTALITGARARMAQLTSVQLHEELTGGAGTTLVTDYVEAAPDRLQWRQASGAALYQAGAVRFSRAPGAGTWTVERDVQPVPEPAFAWQYFTTTVAAHVLGRDSTAGVPTTAVGFFAGTPGTPVWFVFWIDGDGLVRRSLMLAPGHFMQQAFAGFDTAAPTSPTGAAAAIH